MLPFAMPFVIPAVVKRFWKPALVVVLVIGSVWGFTVWKQNLEDTAWASGFAEAEQQFKAKIDKANYKVVQQQAAIDQYSIILQSLTNQKMQDINLKIQPIIKDAKDEVAQNPIYSDCRVTDGMLNRLNAGRAAVDEAIRPGDTKID